MKALSIGFCILSVFSSIRTVLSNDFTVICDFDSILVDNIFTPGGVNGQSIIIDNPMPDETCPATKVFRFVASAGTWKMVGFENNDGTNIEPISLLDAENIQFKIRGNDLTHAGIRLNVKDGFKDLVIDGLVPGQWNIVVIPFPPQYLEITNLIIIPNQNTNGASGREYLIADIVLKDRPGTGGNDVVSIELNRNELSLMTGDVFAFEAIVRPTSAIDPTLEWSSGDTNIVKVDTLGNITVTGPGTTIVVARSVQNNTVADTCVISALPLSEYVVLTDFENVFVNEIYNPNGQGQITDNPYKNENCSANKVYEYTRGSGNWDTWGFLVNPNIDLSTFDYLHMQIRGVDLNTIVSQVQDGAISQEGDWHTGLTSGKWNVMRIEFLKQGSSDPFETLRNINFFVNPENSGSAGKKYYIANIVLVRKGGDYSDEGIPGIPDTEPVTTIWQTEPNATETLWPNPATDQVHLPCYQTGSVAIFDQNGKSLQEMYPIDGTLNIKVLPNGNYFVKTGNKTYKLIKR